MSLVKRLKNNEEDAYQHIINRYGSIFMHMSINKLHNYEDSLDCVQDIYLKIFMSIHNYREDDKKLNSWILKIAKNQICDCQRKQIHKNRNMVANNEVIEIMSDRKPIKHAMLEDLKEFIGEEDFELLSYRIVAGFTYKEIGEVTGLPAYTVRRRINELYDISRKFVERRKRDAQK